MIEPANLLQEMVRQSRSPMVMTLATVAGDQSPRARSVICRRIDDDHILWFTTDSRSPKCEQLLAHAAAEAVWWIPDARQQFRFRGAVDIIDAQNPMHDRDVFWRQLSDESRAMFFWPAPGTPRVTDSDSFARRVSADQAPPVTFVLLALRASEIEHLDLTRISHSRRLWRASTSWRCEELNP